MNCSQPSSVKLQKRWLIETLLICVLCFQQNMDGIPDYTIPTILSFLDVKQAHKCACVSKQWDLHVQRRLAQIREEAVQKRAHVCEFNCCGTMDYKSASVVQLIGKRDNQSS